MAMDIIFPMQYFLCLSSKRRPFNISKEASHSFEKTPKELIDKFANYEFIMFLLFCNETFVSLSFPDNIYLEVRFITNREFENIQIIT